MKKLFLVPFFLVFIITGVVAQDHSAAYFPDSISSGKQGKFHVQGIAIDKKERIIYYSFTDKLVKMDFNGHLIGSVTGLVGHLGDLTYDPETRKVYGSLEYKDDAIGKGISKKLGVKNTGNINFYIAIFDGPKITKPDMDAAEDNVLKTIYLKEVVKDYKARVKTEDKLVEHRFGCSGIDGITLAPPIGKPNAHKKFLYVAYGIYGDSTRDDNDHQVILKYNRKKWPKLAKRLTQKNLHHSGPEKPMAKYFVKTGNTRWGIQNLEYDSYTGNIFAAVYKGFKTKFPNYSLFVIDARKKPKKALITSDNKQIKVKTLSLLDAGLRDKKTGIRGWNFKWGATGLFPIGGGLFYISHNKKAKDGRQETTIYKYEWVGTKEKAFRLVD